MEEHVAHLQSCMYQYSRAIYRSIKDLIDPYADERTQLEYAPRRARGVRADDGAPRRPTRSTSPVPTARCSRTSAATSRSPRRPRSRGRCARVSAAAIAFIEQQIEAGAFDGGIARCKATTRKGKACQRTPLPSRDYCPSHQHLEARPRSPRKGTRRSRSLSAAQPRSVPAPTERRVRLKPHPTVSSAHACRTTPTSSSGSSRSSRS